MLVTATTNSGSTALVDIKTEDPTASQRLGEFLGKLLLAITLGETGILRDPVNTARFGMKCGIEWQGHHLTVRFLFPVASLEEEYTDAVQHAVMELLTEPARPPGEKVTLVDLKDEITAIVSVNETSTMVIALNQSGQYRTFDPTEVIQTTEVETAVESADPGEPQTEALGITALIASAPQVPAPRKSAARHARGTPGSRARHVSGRT